MGNHGAARVISECRRSSCSSLCSVATVLCLVLYQVDKILKVIPRERNTFLFSATMTKKVAKLQRASLRNPVKVEVSSKYQTVEKLQQHYVFIPAKFKVRINFFVFLIHWPLGDADGWIAQVLIFEMIISRIGILSISCEIALRCDKTSLMISQHWLR